MLRKRNNISARQDRLIRQNASAHRGRHAKASCVVRDDVRRDIAAGSAPGSFLGAQGHAGLRAFCCGLLARRAISLLMVFALVVGMGMTFAYATEGSDPGFEGGVSEPAFTPPADEGNLPDDLAGEEPAPDNAAPVSAFDAAAVYEYALGLGDEAAIEEYLIALSDEERAALLAYVQQLEGEVPIEYGEAVQGENAFATTDFTDAAPLVKEQPRRMLMAAGGGAKGGSNGSSASADADGLEVSKTVTPLGNDQYKLTLEAFTTGQVLDPRPADIVLVFDQSASMDEIFTSGQRQYNIVNFKRSYFTLNTYSPNNITFATMGNLFYKLSNGTYSHIEVSWAWGTYTYRWLDEGGNERSASSFGSLLDVPSELRGNAYQMQTISGDKTRTEALQETAADFISSIQDDAQQNDRDHRVAVVGFGSTGDFYEDSAWENTELLSTSSVVGYTDSGISATDYRNALVSANVNGSVNSRLTTAINRLDAGGASFIDYGLTMAQGIFANASDTGEDRKKVVIVLTDGVPGDGTWGSSVTGNASASNALGVADALKNSGATVYTIGIFDGADATSAGSNTGTVPQKNNYFMQNLSSNAGMPSTPSYYLTAGDETNLTSVFSSISSQVISSVLTLDETAIMKDVVSEYFAIPQGTVPSFYTAPCTGKDGSGKCTFGNRVAYTPASGDVSKSGNTVSVKGFDYDANCCTVNGGVASGNKFIMELTVNRASGFFGGNDVPTNEDSSGIYTHGPNGQPKILESFPLPLVNVPFEDITITVPNVNLYNGSQLFLRDQVKAASVVSPDLSSAEFATLESKTCTWDASARTYTVVATVKATTDGQSSVNPSEANPYGSAAGATGEGTGQGYVFMPKATFKDSEVSLGQIIPTDFSGNMVGSLAWYCVELSKYDTQVTMFGNAAQPAATFTYTVDVPSGTTTVDSPADIGVYVSLAANGVTYAHDYLGFAHQICTDRIDVLGGHNFLLHVKTGRLTITKMGSQDSAQQFLFKVMNGSTLVATVAVVGNDSVTLTGLPLDATYTVTEDTAWSWRYAPDAASKQIALTSSSTSGTVTFSNTCSNNSWLNGFGTAINVFTSVATS